VVGRVDTGVQKTAARGFDRVHRTLCGGVRKGGGTRTGTWGRKRLAFDQNQEPVPSPKRLSRSQHTWIPAPYRPYRTDFSQSILLRLQRVQRPRATPQAADTTSRQSTSFAHLPPQPQVWTWDAVNRPLVERRANERRILASMELVAGWGAEVGVLSLSAPSPSLPNVLPGTNWIRCDGVQARAGLILAHGDCRPHTRQT